MNPMDLGQWFYMIYLLPGGVSLLLLLLSLVGGGHHHRMGGHAGHHPRLGGHGGAHGAKVKAGVASVGHATGHSMDATHGPGHAMHGIGHAAHVTGHAAPGTGHAGHAQARSKPGQPRAVTRASNGVPGQGGEENSSFGALALSFFGFGQAPALFLWGGALLGWGLAGFWATAILRASLHAPALFGLPAALAALIGGAVVMRSVAFLFTRLVPATETFALSTVDLCGLAGTAAFPVTEAQGRVHVFDTFGTMHDVTARVAPGQPPIPRGQPVLVVDYDAAADRVVVEERP